MPKTDDFDYRGFGHRLRVTRIALAITQAEAASAAGRSVHTWQKYETTGKGFCTIAIIRFARHYDLSVDWLVSGNTARVRPGLTKGKVAVLPANGLRGRKAPYIMSEWVRS